MAAEVETAAEAAENAGSTKAKRGESKWTPYVLILPTVLFLALFFAYPMVRGLGLAVYDDEAFLALRDAPSLDAAETGRLRQNSQIRVSDKRANVVDPSDLEETNLVAEIWYQVSGDGADGQAATGWAPEARIRVRSEDDSGAPIGGTVRSRIGEGAEQLTPLLEEPGGDAAIAGQLESGAEVAIEGQTVLETWYSVTSDGDERETVEGWAQSRFIQVFQNGETGRIDRGDSGEFTTRFIKDMVDGRFFTPAVKTTLLLMVIIIPIQFVLAVIMALVIQARLRGHTTWLYIFSIPLGVSELAVGIIFFAIFTQNGFLNSILQGIGLIDSPPTYLSAESRNWILAAIVLAELWRATSIVMIIVVSGLQAISDEVLEAAELFGATLWRRIRYVILPLLRPSIQVALILRTILALQVFAVVIALGGGTVVTVLAREAYRQYDDLRNVNVAGAYAVFILLLSMISAVLYLYTMRSQLEKEAS